MHRLVALWVASLVLVISGVLGAGSALGQVEDAASPALGQSSVIAQGVTAAPAGDIAWRVTRATATTGSDQVVQGSPGFILADQGALLLSDLDAGRQTRLASGEAAFIPAETPRQEAPLGEGSATYYRIDLVPGAEVNTAGVDELLFVGEPFASPGGNRDLDLTREVLDAGESLQLALGSHVTPSLLLVTSGAVELIPAENPDAAPVSLPAGQGAAIGGDVIARAADGAEAAFVTAIVGPEVPLTLAQDAETPTPELASLIVQALACPVAYQGAQYATDCVEPVADIAFDLFGNATAMSFQGTTGADGAVLFADLTPDAYTLTGGVPGEFAEQAVECASETGPAPTEVSQTAIPGAVVTLAAGDAVTCNWYVVPENLRGESEGTVAVSVFLCPGTPVDPSVDCSLGDASGVVIDGPVVLTTDASSAVPVQIDGGSLVWGEAGGLPFGTYFLQPGGIAVAEGYELSEVRGSVGGSGNGWTFVVDETTPNAVLEVIYVPAAQPQADADADGDGLSDAQEAELGTDPANPDTDEDGLFDVAEVAAGTNPVLPDSDGDGFGDNAEAINGSDANDPASVPPGESSVDTDGDMLTDAEEAELGTNAATPDSDGDGVGDGDEVANGTDPTRGDG